MAYGTVAGVEAILPVLGTLSGSTTPTSTEVGGWLTEGSAVIDRHVTGAGFAVPVAASATLYSELSSLANLYAAAQSMQARSIDNLTGAGEDRASIWLDRFYAQLKDIAASDLSLLGATVIPTPTTAGSGRRRIRTLQLRRVDGYSAAADDVIGYHRL
jgi:hypothetical protein